MQSNINAVLPLGSTELEVLRAEEGKRAYEILIAEIQQQQKQSHVDNSAPYWLCKGCGTHNVFNADFCSGCGVDK